MNTHEEFPDHLLHSFVDGQLAGNDRERLLATLEEDVDLRERVCALRRTKEWVNLAFEGAQAPQHPLPQASGGNRLIRMFGLAASVLLLSVGFLLGWISSASHEPINSVVLRDIQAGTHKVVLHIDRSDPSRFIEVLDSAEQLLRDYQNQGVEIDVLANAGGIDLLRADISPHAQRIARMMREHKNLQFIACTNTLQRLREKGITPVLIDHTQQDSTAVEHIINRLQMGWAYIRV